MKFFKKIKNQINRKNSLVCVGLDPSPDRVDNIVDFCSGIIESTSEVAVAYKINSAFYEPYSWEDMLKVIKIAKENSPVILDCKRADIRYSSKFYSRLLEIADSITVNPYLGFESLKPFFDKKGGVFILCKTTMGNKIQEAGSEPIYLKIAKLARNQEYEDIGLVVGATEEEGLRKVRRVCDLPFLVPGIGAQGGNEKMAVSKGLNSRGVGLISSSRSIIYSDNPASSSEDLRKRINRYRETVN